MIERQIGPRPLDFLPEGRLTIGLGLRDWWSVVHPEVIKTVSVDVRAGKNDTLAIQYAAERPVYKCVAGVSPAKATEDQRAGPARRPSPGGEGERTRERKETS